MTSTTTHPEDHEATSPLHAYVKVLRRHWLLVILVFVLTVLSAVVFTSRQTPIYEAAATVMIDPEPRPPAEPPQAAG